MYSPHLPMLHVELHVVLSTSNSVYPVHAEFAFRLLFRIVGPQFLAARVHGCMGTGM